MRRAALLALAIALAGCATAVMDRADVAEVARDAIDDAGIDASSVEVADTGDDDTWPVDVVLDGGVAALSIDRTSGAVATVDVPEGVDLTADQLQSLAAHRGNPADRAARRTRALIGAVTVVLLLAGGFLAAHRARLREWG